MRSSNCEFLDKLRIFAPVWQGKIDMVSNIDKARFARLKGKMGKVEFKSLLD